MRKMIYTLASVLALILLWFLISHFNIVSSFFLPSPYAVLLKFTESTKTGSLLAETGATLLRMFSGLVLACAIGIPLGMLMGYFERIYMALEFVIEFLRNIPPPTLFPLFMLFLGVGNRSKIAVVVFACSFYILINTMYGVKSVKRLRIRLAKIMKLSNFNLFRKIILPESLPHIAAGIRIATTLSLILVIVFEMFAGTRFGLGRMIVDAQLMYEVEVIYVGIVTAGIIGYSWNKILILSEKRLLHWSGK